MFMPSGPWSYAYPRTAACDSVAENVPVTGRPDMIFIEVDSCTHVSTEHIRAHITTVLLAK